jgi:streptogramin lyase
MTTPAHPSSTVTFDIVVIGNIGIDTGAGGRKSACRRRLRRWAARVSLAAAASMALHCTSEPAVPDDAPEGPYEVVKDWPRIPEGMVFGKALDVAVDSLGRVFVAHTGSRGQDNRELIPEPTVFVFDPDTGDLLDAWGEGLFAYPHGIEIDRDDHVWVTDSVQNRIFKLDTLGNVMMTLGER